MILTCGLLLLRSIRHRVGQPGARRYRHQHQLATQGHPAGTPGGNGAARRGVVRRHDTSAAPSRSRHEQRVRARYGHHAALREVGPARAVSAYRLPAWLAFYPGAKVITANAPPAGWQPQTVTDMRTYKVELTTTASVSQVAAFYKETMAQNGLTIVSETQSQDWSYAFEARSADRMHQVYLDVLKRAKDTHVSLLDHYTLPRR